MANSSTGTASFRDCGCGNCQAGRTHDDALSHVAPEHGLDPKSLAKRHNPLLQEGAYTSIQKLPLGSSYTVQEIDGHPHLMARKHTLSSTLTADATRDRWRAEVAQNAAYGERQRAYHERRLADPAASVRRS